MTISLFHHLCASSKTWVENGTANLSWVDIFWKQLLTLSSFQKQCTVTVRQKRLPIHHHEKGFWDFRSLDSPFNPSLVLASFGQSSCFSTIMTVKAEPSNQYQLAHAAQISSSACRNKHFISKFVFMAGNLESQCGFAKQRINYGRYN